MNTMTGGEALVAGLAAHGVDTVFGIPGTHNLSIYAAFAKYDITHILSRHEQGSGYAADGYARSTGRPGVVVTTTGPAILNAAAAAAQAYSDSIPVLFISPGMPVNHPGLGNGLLHEVKDQGTAMASVVAYSHRVTSVEEIPLAVAQAFGAMSTGRRRPVHLEIPFDLLESSAEVVVVEAVPAAVLSAPEVAVDNAGTALSAAERPILIVGGGASRAADQVAAIAELLGAPVIATTNGKGVFPEDHALSIGAGVQHRSVLAAIDDSDCVLAIGTEFAPSDWWLGPPDVLGKLIRIDIDAISINTNAVPTHGLIGDSRIVLDQLVYRLARTPSDGTERATLWRARFLQDAQTEGAPWLDIVAAIAAALPRNTIVAADSSMSCYYAALSNLPLFRPNAFLYPTGGGTLGYGLPAGVGAKVANPDVPVVVMQGDGGIMFTVAELAMAAEIGIALPVIVVDNGGYGEIRNEMADRREPIHAVALGHPDFAKLAESLGCHGVRIGSPGELTEAIKNALAADRPTVLHVREDGRAAAGML